jgi:hypothetical protein
MAAGNLPDVVSIDQPKPAGRGDHEPVEDVGLRHLQHVLEGVDLGAAGAQHRRP